MVIVTSMSIREGNPQTASSMGSRASREGKIGHYQEVTNRCVQPHKGSSALHDICYSQRATVLVSYNAWPSLFTELIKHIGSMLLTHGLPVLESVCHSIASWYVRQQS